MLSTYLFESVLNTDIRVTIYELAMENHSIDISKAFDQSPLGGLIEVMPALKSETEIITSKKKWRKHHTFGLYSPEETVFTCAYRPLTCSTRLCTLVNGGASTRFIQNLRIDVRDFGPALRWSHDRSGSIALVVFGMSMAN